MSSNEKYLGIGFAAVIGLAGLYYFGLQPYLATRADLEDQIKARQATLDSNKLVTTKQASLKKPWDEIQKNGLKLDASFGDQQLSVNMNKWIKDAGLVQDSVHPDRTITVQQFDILSQTYTLTGTTLGLNKLLWSIETANIPVRITDMGASTSKDSVDNLTLHVSVTALCMPPSGTKSNPSTMPEATTAASPVAVNQTTGDVGQLNE